MTKIWKNYTGQKNYYFILSKIEIYLSLSLHKGRPCYRKSLQPQKREHPALQISNFFSIFVGHLFVLLGPDPKHC
jgi:hypothetical protein